MEETFTHYIVCWNQYGNWSSTRPMNTHAEAQTHIKRVLRPGERGHEHYKQVTIVEIELPSRHLDL